MFTTIIITALCGMLFGAFLASTVYAIADERKKSAAQTDIQAELRMSKALQDYKEMVLIKHAQVHEARVFHADKWSAVYCGDQCVARYNDEDSGFNRREACELCEKINSANA